MDEEERKRLIEKEYRQRIPADTLKYVLADERIVWFWIDRYYPSPKREKKPKYGMMVWVLLDNKDGGRVLRHWVRPENKGILHNEPKDEWMDSYGLKDVYNIADEYFGDFGSHVETSGSTYGSYAGWDGSGIGSMGGETHSRLVQHERVQRITISFKTADGNLHKDIFQRNVPTPEAEQSIRLFWNNMKKRCGLIAKGAGNVGLPKAKEGAMPPISPMMAPQRQQEPKRISRPSAIIRFSPEQVKLAFLKEFYEGEQPDPSNSYGGCIMSRDRIMMLIPRDTKPEDAGNRSNVVKTGRSLAQGTPIEEVDDPSGVQMALIKAKNASPNPQYAKKYVTFGGSGTAPETHVNIDYFTKALNVLGGRKIRVYSEGKDRPIYAVNDQRDTIAIAPALDVQDNEAITYQDVVSLFTA